MDGRPTEAWTLTAGQRSVLRFVELPAGALSGAGAYAVVRVSAVPPAGQPAVPVALTQFDAAPLTTLQWGFDAGWHDDEVDLRTARRFRWTSGEASLVVRGAQGDLRVRVEVAAPGPSFTDAPVVQLRCGEAVLAEVRSLAAFTLDAHVPAGTLAGAGGRITLTTSATFSPAERGQSADQRRLGLRVERVEITAEP